MPELALIAWASIWSPWPHLIEIHLTDGAKIATKINYFDCPNYCTVLALAKHFRKSKRTG